MGDIPNGWLAWTVGGDNTIVSVAASPRVSRILTHLHVRAILTAAGANCTFTVTVLDGALVVLTRTLFCTTPGAAAIEIDRDEIDSDLHVTGTPATALKVKCDLTAGAGGVSNTQIVATGIDLP